MIQVSGSTYCVYEWEELTSLKFTYYPKQSLGSTQFLSGFQLHSHRTRTNITKIYMEPQKVPRNNSNSEEEERS